MPLRKLFMRKLDCSLPRVLYGQYVGLKAIDTKCFSLSWAIKVLIKCKNYSHWINNCKYRNDRKVSCNAFFEKAKVQNERHWGWKKAIGESENWIWNQNTHMEKLCKTRWVKCLSKIVSSLYSIWRVTNYRYVPLCTVKKDALGTWHISLKRTAFSPRAFFTPMSSISAFCFFKKALQEIFLSFSLLASTTTSIKI